MGSEQPGLPGPLLSPLDPAQIWLLSPSPSRADACPSAETEP